MSDMLCCALCLGVSAQAGSRGGRSEEAHPDKPGPATGAAVNTGELHLPACSFGL
jgi:hypothetical protein